LRTLELAGRQAEHGHIVLIGINPTFASTGFGYIERGGALTDGVYEAVRFTEKPREEVAEQYFAGGMHSWNSGMFIMRVATGMGEFTRQHATFAGALTALQAHIGADTYGTALDAAWTISPKLSIDYAIMENAQKLAVIPVDIGWSDIGSWAALLEALPRDQHENAISGEHVTIDTVDTLIRAEGGRLIATIGVGRLVIVDTPDALLVCSLDRVQDVKKVVDELKKSGKTDLT
jgi:mannose-1-phosphate guanylyltransferase